MRDRQNVPGKPDPAQVTLDIETVRKLGFFFINNNERRKKKQKKKAWLYVQGYLDLVVPCSACRYLLLKVRIYDITFSLYK